MRGEKLQHVIDERVKPYPGCFMVFKTRLVHCRRERYAMVYAAFSSAATRPERMAFTSAA